MDRLEWSCSHKGPAKIKGSQKILGFLMDLLMDLWISFGFQRFPEELQRHRFGSFLFSASQYAGRWTGDPRTSYTLRCRDRGEIREVKAGYIEDKFNWERLVTTLETNKGNRMDTWESVMFQGCIECIVHFLDRTVLMWFQAAWIALLSSTQFKHSICLPGSTATM